MRFRLLLPWFALLVPTLLLGVGALYLLRGEEERLAQRDLATAREQVTLLAGNLDLAVADVEEGLVTTLQSLAATPQVQWSDVLEAWKRENPLVRNVFIWREEDGLLYPPPDAPASDEEEGFIRRYQALFAETQAWLEPPRASAAADTTSSLLSGRQELLKLARQAPEAAAVAESDVVSESEGESGWRSWFADNRLHLIGWYRLPDNGPRLGVEMEMMALLDRLLATVTSPAVGETVALLDGEGAVFHQSGPLEIAPGAVPVALHLLQRLPHWQVALYADPAATKAGDGYILIAALLIGIFLLTSLSGGSLLLWQAHRNQREARQKTSFVANVSHELKTPLTTIRMYSELLAEGRLASEEKRQSYLQTIIRESQRLTRLVNNVLDFSRLEQGRKEFASQPLDLVPLLQDLLANQQLRFDEVGMTLQREELPPAAPFSGDRDAVEQILLNLIDNALKYAASGGRFAVTLHEHEGFWCIDLCDDGPGIPAPHREAIFRQFHRIDTSLTAQPGSGLGLSIARQLALGMGGTLDYRAEGAKGACFRLRLPKRRES